MPTLSEKIHDLLSLRFEDKEFEKAFRVYSFEESLVRVRLSLLLAIIVVRCFWDTGRANDP